MTDKKRWIFVSPESCEVQQSDDDDVMESYVAAAGWIIIDTVDNSYLGLGEEDWAAIPEATEE